MRNFLLLISILFTFSLNAQVLVTWDNGGDGTSWDDGANWDTDQIPAAGDTVKIGGNLVITGTAANNPARVLVNWGMVQFDLDLTIDGISANAFTAWGTVIFNSGTYTINPAAGKIGLETGGNPITIGSLANINVNGGNMSVKVGSGGLTNNGNMYLENATVDALRIIGTLNNYGFISHNTTVDVGMTIWGTLNNHPSGELRSHGSHDRIIVSGAPASLTNDGFINGGNGFPVVVTGGASFINNGLVKSWWGQVVSVGSTVINNGFYKYDVLAPFARDWGGNPMGTDNGIDLRDPMRTAIDADAGNGTVTIANNSHNYSWSTQNSFQDGHSSSSTRGSGSLNTTDGNATLPANFFDDGATVDVISTTWPTHVILQVKQAVLPVELVSFNVTKKDHTVLIDWSTASEINSDFIAVERSQDGKSFSELGREQSRGNSNRLIDYSMVDNAPSNGMNYYRLKQVDRDGKLEYSNVKSVNILKETKSWNIFPTMVSKNQSFSLDLAEFENKSVKVYVYDLVGNIIWYDTLTGGNTNNISLENVSNGIYLISIINGNTKSTKRITIF